MSFLWLKRYMPRGLYGRAALILILPVITLQLVVSVVFIQRHFEGVARQMTQTAVQELRLVLGALETAPDRGAALVAANALARPLRLEISFAAPGTVPRAQKRWYDFSGREVIRTFEREMPVIRAVQLPDDDLVRVFVDTGLGLVQADFQRRRLSPRNPHQLFVNMLVFGVLMTLIAFIYLRNQLRPIKRLAEAATAFGRGRTEPYHPSGAVEVRAAGEAFLDMRDRIERQIEQRTLMLSGVSHDLRTPLTRLKLGLSMLEDEDRAALERDVTDMQHLLDGFLDFARGAGAGTVEPTDPQGLVARVVADCARAGQAVTLVAQEGAGEMPLRPLVLRRAVENLVGNAVRYAGRAEVSVRLDDGHLHIVVEDDGPGIDAARREEALKPFTRLDAARNQNLGSGVGLGLTIAADAARAHGGELRLGESARLGGLRAEIVIAR